MSKNVIPISKFVDITSKGVSDAFTFNRLNALIVTKPKIPMKKKYTVTNLEEVVKFYSSNGAEYKYASHFFGYTSKNATKAEKLSFFNYYPEPTGAAIVGAEINKLKDIKINGRLDLNINEETFELDLDLSSTNSFSDVAEKITEKLKKESKEAVPYALIGTDTILPITASGTIDANNFIIQDENDDAIFTYTASLTLNNKNIDQIVSALNTEKLASANLTWKNDEGKLKVSQIIFSSENNTIPAKIFISETDIKNKLGLNNVIKISGLPAVDEQQIATCKYSDTTKSFIIETNKKNAEQVINYATNTLASKLKLSKEKGAYIITGSNTEPISDLMDDISTLNGDYFSISFIDNIISDDNFEELADFAKNSNGRYMVIAYSDNNQLLQPTPVFEKLFGSDGFCLIKGNSNMASFLQAAIASVDFTHLNSALNFNFIECPEFIDEAVGTASELDALHINKANTAYLMGGYGQNQCLFGEGAIFGAQFSDISGYIGNSWLKAKMEIAAANLFISNPLIALRGKAGTSLILASLQSVIDAAKNNGIIATVGINNLLSSEANAIIAATGSNNVVKSIESNGYYINILPLTNEDLNNKRMRVQFIYTRNVPINRLVISSLVL